MKVSAFKPKTFGVALIPKKKHDNISFHSAMRLPLVIAKIFGFFPVQGLTNSNHRELRFSWYSFCTLYSILTSIAIFGWSLTAIHKIIYIDNGLNEISGLMFSSCALISSLLFISLAREWPEFVDFWHSIEIYMGNKEIKTNLNLKVKYIALGFLISGAVEHLLVQMSGVMYAFKCTRTISQALERYFGYTSFSHFFLFTEYKLWKGILLEVVNTQMTFSWTFVDVFIMVISTCYTVRITQLLTKVENLIKNNVKSVLTWRELREEHCQIRNLCQRLDRKIGHIIILCFWTNLYYTLIQLYSNLKDEEQDILRRAYFSVSFLFLIVRTVCVCLYGAAINDESQQILPVLLSASSDLYNVEIKRFIEQVSQSTLALSGKNFFKITKGIILNIAGAIVTYELVLIQFRVDPDDNDEYEPPVNTSWWLC